MLANEWYLGVSALPLFRPSEIVSTVLMGPTAAEGPQAPLFKINILSLLPYLLPKQILLFQISGQKSNDLANS